MKKILPLCIPILLSISLLSDGKDQFPYLIVTNGTLDSASLAYSDFYYHVPYCTSLDITARISDGGKVDSAFWFNGEILLEETFEGDTFHATLAGTYHAMVYFTDPVWGYTYYSIGWYFLTLSSPCPSPSSNFSSTNISSTTAKLHWQTLTCAIGYKVQYRDLGTSTWISKTVNTNSGARKLNGLAPNTTYQWKVRTKCAGEPNVFSEFSAKQTFTTASVRESQTAHHDSQLILYPNPASDNIFIEGSSISNHAELRIMNYLGQIVMDKILDGNYNEPVSISSLPSGNYFVIVKDEENVSTGTFIKE